MIYFQSEQSFLLTGQLLSVILSLLTLMCLRTQVKAVQVTEHKEHTGGDSYGI